MNSFCDVCEQELLGQVGHYSERVRKDAITGLGSLLARHPEELRRQVHHYMQHGMRWHPAW